MTHYNDPARVDPRTIVSFWRAAGPGRWFSKSDLFDAEVRRRLGRLYEWAADGRLDYLAQTAQGTLALLILLDQAPRNMFRGSAQAFETDQKARDIAIYALSRGLDQRVPKAMRGFFYLPFMHSEDEADQELCLALYEDLGDENSLKYAQIHLDIIREFGRFPHRNDVLGRATSPEEQKFLDAGGFAG